jgi:hypothetical protein
MDSFELYAEAAYMIGGSFETLKDYIHEMNNFYSSKENTFFSQFKLVQIRENLWVFALCHHALNWTIEVQLTWSYMFTSAKGRGLICSSECLFFREEMPDDSPYAEEQWKRQTIKGLANVYQRLDVNPKLAAAFNY